MRRVLEKYEEMLGRGIMANQTIITTIMDEYGRNGDSGNARIWFKEMESNGIHADQKAKTILPQLAKTYEERQEANELVGHSDEVGSLIAINGFVAVGDDDEDDDDELEEVEGNYEYFDAQLAMAYEEQSR